MNTSTYRARSLVLVLGLTAAACAPGGSDPSGTITGSPSADTSTRGDFVVGAPAASDAAGRVYVYARPGDTQPAVLQGDDSPGARFGASVANVGDTDGDGTADLLVGTGHGGRAYLFLRGAGATRVTLGAPDGASTHFGREVAALGDVDGDGRADFAVADDDSGHVYLYRGGNVTTPWRTLAPADGVGTSFGSALATGDVDGDGRVDLVVGQPYVGDAQSWGRVAVFTGASIRRGETAPDAMVLNPDTQVANFGASLAIAGDLDADGFADLAVGTSDGAGRVYLFNGTREGLASTPARTFTGDGTEGVYFAQSVAAAGDVNGDGIDDLAVGAAGYEPGSPSRVHVYFGARNALPSAAGATIEGPTGSGFGWSVAAAGDLDGDGVDDLLVGAPLEGQSAGALHVVAGRTYDTHDVAAVSADGRNELGRAIAAR